VIGKGERRQGRLSIREISNGLTTTTADDKEIRVNMDNVRCLYLGRSGLTDIVFDGEHQVAVKDKMETLVSKTPAVLPENHIRA
jgi:hypothetical protein